nr:hypothetical protein [Nocardiopsis kunsanensis]
MGDPVDRLLRWEEHGGTWRVITRGPDGVTVELCTCTGGEAVDRWTSDDPDLVALVSAAPPPSPRTRRAGRSSPDRSFRGPGRAN